MPTVDETRPFPGAKTVYGRVYRLLHWMGQSGHVTIDRKKGKPTRCTPSAEMTSIIEALNRGDEETLKAALLDPQYFNHW